MLDNDPNVPNTSSDDPNNVVFFNHDGEGTSSKFVDWYKSVMIDENWELRKIKIEKSI